MADDLTLIDTVIPAVSGGLTGATSTFRLVGAMASGTTPGSGTFSTGDVIIVLTGGVIVCTAGGSPGTWASVGGGGGMSNPMTTAGDLIDGGSGGTPQRLAIGTASGSTGDFLGITSGAPAWQQVSGQYLCTPTSYAPGTQTSLTAATTSFSQLSASVNTGSFTAPASGSVVVEVSLAAEASASGAYGFGLANHGTTTMQGNAIIYKDNVASFVRPYMLAFLVTGLTAGSSYNFDLMGVASSTNTLTVSALGLSSASPSLTNQGAPVVMAVRAV